ncbi:EI24 domain-containing protein [Streptomyces sp. OF3]|uniref:EI24 domain-containing protein n=1 Tax=Streptomyces alkaliterrae TaxID=2213162 RepID=A0A7W3WMV8_9ACTN|nr:EI24 domain-containing protein [Streptomyces alkaliterrae]MBB1255243.1 EI24 domain-containing protein [Streptomyces alkaliterrae]
MGDLATGLRYFARGQRWMVGHGRLYAFCLIPALIALVLYLAALVALAFHVGDFAAWATPFAADWSDGPRATLRVSLALLLFLFGLLLALLTFTAVTLLIGDPFYESLSEKVDEEAGPVPDAPELPLWRELWISLIDSARVLGRALLFTVPLFLLGFVPFIGQTVVPVLGFMVSGYFLTVELTSVAMRRRGADLHRRLAMLRARRGLAWGFGTPLAVCFVVPFAAVFLMPGAVAGATLLTREMFGENVTDERAPAGV